MSTPYAAAAANKAAKARSAKKASPARPKVGPKSGPAPAREKLVETTAKVRALRLAKSGVLRQRGHTLASGWRNQSKWNRR